MTRGHTTYKLLVCLGSQEMKVLGPQHSVGEQAGKGNGREGGSLLWPLQCQSDDSNGKRREPRPYSKAQWKGLAELRKLG